MQDIVAELQRNELFRGISAEDIRTLLDCLHPVRHTYDKDTLIWREGEQTRAAGLVLRGKVLILRDDFWGNRNILGEAGAGDLFGEAYACTPDARLTVSVLAAAACEVLFVEIPQILTACSRVCAFHTRLIQNLMQVLAGKNLMLSRKIDHISRRTTREKLLAYLSDQAEVHGTAAFEIPFNRQQLADYLSVDRSALSQELGKMKRDGLLDCTRSRFTLHTDVSGSSPKKIRIEDS